MQTEVSEAQRKHDTKLFDTLLPHSLKMCTKTHGVLKKAPVNYRFTHKIQTKEFKYCQHQNTKKQLIRQLHHMVYKKYVKHDKTVKYDENLQIKTWFIKSNV